MPINSSGGVDFEKLWLVLVLKRLTVDDEANGRWSWEELEGRLSCDLPLNGEGLAYSGDEGGLALLDFLAGATSRMVDAPRSISTFRIVDTDVFSSISAPDSSRSASRKSSSGTGGSGGCEATTGGGTLALDRADDPAKREAASNLKEELTLEAEKGICVLQDIHVAVNTKLTFL